MLIFLCSISCVSAGWAQEDKSISETLKEERQTNEQYKQEIQKKRQEAGSSHDKSVLMIWDNIEAVLEAKSQCFKKDEDIEMHLCIHEAIKKLAEEGNFAAQDSVAKTYMAKPQENYAMALSWFKKALENPKTPSDYKQFILEDVQKIEALLKESNKNNSLDEKPISASLKEEMAHIINEQSNIQKEIKKSRACPR